MGMESCHISYFKFLLFLLFVGRFCSSADVYYTLDITDGTISPACVTRPGILINNQFPGPALSANTGDNLIIHVTNSMKVNSIVFHWHGIHQRGTSHYDGVTGATQCEILPGKSFTYSFGLFEQEGTYWYHAHHALWGGTAYGSLVIYNQTRAMTTPYGPYDEEMIILLSDFFQKSEYDMHHGLFNETFQWIGDPDAILVNGKSVINCTKFSFSSTPSAKWPSQCLPDTCQFPVINLKPNRTYRLRVIGATFLSHLTFAIDGHTFDIVEADGYFVQKQTASVLLVNSGERYSLILKTKAETELGNNSGWWASARIRWRTGDPQNGLVFFRYITNSSVVNSSFIPPPPSPTVFSQNWNESMTFPYTLKGSTSNAYVPPVPKSANTTIILVGRHERVNNIVKWTVNRLAMGFPESSSLLPYVYDNQTDSLNDTTAPIELEYGEVVDVIFQDTAALNGVCEQHPWHIHGHSFYILAYGSGNFTNDQASKFNLVDPPYRDQVTVYPTSGAFYTDKIPTGTECGWTAVRFVADNPGVWALHCHIHAHMDMGMMVTFAESTDRLPRLPGEVVKQLQQCFNFSASFLENYPQNNEDNNDNKRTLAIVLPIVFVTLLVVVVAGVYFMTKKDTPRQDVMMM